MKFSPPLELEELEDMELTSLSKKKVTPSFFADSTNSATSAPIPPTGTFQSPVPFPIK